MRSILVLAFVLCSIFYSHAVLAKSPKAPSGVTNAEQAESNGADKDTTAGYVESVTPPGAVAGNDSQNQRGDSSSSKPATVKDNSLPNLRALLNIIANGIEILCLALGAPACLLVPVGLVLVWMKGKRWWGAAMILVGPVVVILGLAAPGVMNILLEAMVETAKAH